MSKKGMSQTLALIVAASVLMMTALTVIFMTQGSLQGVFGDTAEQECVKTIQTTCKFSSGEEHATPSACKRAGIADPSGLPDSSIVSDLDNKRYICSR